MAVADAIVEGVNLISLSGWRDWSDRQFSSKIDSAASHYRLYSETPIDLLCSSIRRREFIWIIDNHCEARVLELRYLFNLFRRRLRLELVRYSCILRELGGHWNFNRIQCLGDSGIVITFSPVIWASSSLRNLPLELHMAAFLLIKSSSSIWPVCFGKFDAIVSSWNLFFSKVYSRAFGGVTFINLPFFIGLIVTSW